MPTFQESISLAVKTQAARKGIEYQTIAKTLGMTRATLWRRLTNEKTWDTDNFEALANALGLSSSWELLALANKEFIDITDHASLRSQDEEVA
jgi:cyanate lyase